MATTGKRNAEEDVQEDGNDDGFGIIFHGKVPNCKECFSKGRKYETVLLFTIVGLDIFRGQLLGLFPS